MDPWGWIWTGYRLCVRLLACSIFLEAQSLQWLVTEAASRELWSMRSALWPPGVG